MAGTNWKNWKHFEFDVTTSNWIQDGGTLVVNILVFDLRVHLQHCTYQRKTLLFALIKVSTFICERELKSRPHFLFNTGRGIIQGGLNRGRMLNRKWRVYWIFQVKVGKTPKPKHVISQLCYYVSGLKPPFLVFILYLEITTISLQFSYVWLIYVSWIIKELHVCNTDYIIAGTLITRYGTTALSAQKLQDYSVEHFSYLSS